jgi:hypothetical protein
LHHQNKGSTISAATCFSYGITSILLFGYLRSQAGLDPTNLYLFVFFGYLTGFGLIAPLVMVLELHRPSTLRMETLNSTLHATSQVTKRVLETVQVIRDIFGEN